MPTCSALRGAFFLGVLCLWQPGAHALLLGPDFSADYTVTDLGGVPGLPTSYGGLTFLPGDPDTVLIGGDANQSSGLLYTIGVSRDGDGHIDGFSGTVSPYLGGTIGAYNDGGVVFGPGGVLFTARWPVHELGQTKPGSTAEDRIDDMSVIGVPSSSSISAVNFVPTGFPGAGQMKVVTWSSGDWCTVPFSPDGSGTFSLGTASCPLAITGGPEGFVYVDGDNPGFNNTASMLVSEWSAGNVAAYEIDINGDPIPASRRLFLSDLSGAEGAVLDPLTGDFLFSTFGGGDRIVRVSGFTELPPGEPPSNGTPSIPEPATWLLMMAGLAAVQRSRHQGR